MDIMFITEVRKCAALDYPSATVRQLALQKYLKVNGRVDKFLSDVKFKVCHIYTYRVVQKVPPPVLIAIPTKENQLRKDSKILDSILQITNYMVKYSIIGASMLNILCLNH